MNKKEAAIITAFTGISLGGKLFSEFHKYAEEKFNRLVFTHEMATTEFWEKLKELSKPDIMNLIENIED